VKRKRKRPLRAIHDNIIRLRIARGWTQTEFAAQLNIDKSRVCHWERGRTAPSGRIMQKVAATLQVTIDELYGAA